MTTPTRFHATGSPKPPVIGGVRVVGRTISRSVWRLRVVGAEHVPRTGPVLLASNHSGLLDGPLVFVVAPRVAVLLTKAELFAGPLARPLGWLGQVPVHRGLADRTAVRAALDTLAAGGVVGVFPEGSRGAGTLEQVNDGLAYLALRSGAPVVPVAIIGSAAALPRGAKLPKLRAPVLVAFGPPVRLDTVSDPRSRRAVREAAETLRLAMVDHLQTTTREAA